MIRRLFTAASALSFVLFIGTAMLWVRSYWRADGVTLITASYVASAIGGSTAEDPACSYSARITHVDFDSDSGSIFFYVRRSTPDARIPDRETLDHWKTFYPIGTRLRRDSSAPTHDDYPFPYGRFTANEKTDFDKVGFFLGSYTLSYINSDESTPEFRVRVVRLPAWLLLALFGIAPVARVHRRLRDVLRAIRHRPGRCVSCGYDLRASKDRCPECGTPVQSDKAATA